ncbi:uncharacterized protein BXZ73DRAFT_95263 [Epithele typhae]|uniref:uncharacterized protein n=1 Tax=Epithele typhae TaxID=378194 RepID=UPI0020078580|nr:uncharacterized protein BXZ73DRAFT_95263 [Epithele typhae]KAH9893895.1 hypothetical protein BXZ73DRAFT_95263 [Epithele typhae]
MKNLLWIYAVCPLNEDQRVGWITVSWHVALLYGKGSARAKVLRQWTYAFIRDRHDLPFETQGVCSKVSLLELNTLLKSAVMEKLLGVGMNVWALDLVEYLSDPAVKDEFGIKIKVSLASAHVWMSELRFQWKKAPSDQFVDGHKREDVVEYRQNVFLQQLKEVDHMIPQFNSTDSCYLPFFGPCIVGPQLQPLVVLFHDKSTFYAHNRREVRWQECGKTPRPQKKEEAHVLLRAGKNRDGYFTSDCFLTKPEKPLWGVKTNVIGPNGKPLYNQNGKLQKQKIRMLNTMFPDGTAQELYFSDDHPNPNFCGRFKGMVELLEEWGFTDVHSLRSECPTFKCPPNMADQCRCRRLLYNKLDFENTESIAELLCQSCGFGLVFLPKFYCEINPIEQCWCAGKQTYRDFPPSSSKADLEQNLLASLEQVDILKIRRYTNCAFRFMEAYCSGLTGTGATWAAKKYSGHHTLPHDILQQFNIHTLQKAS